MLLWFKMRGRISPGSYGSTVTRNLIVTVLPAGRVKAGIVTVSPDSAGAAGGANNPDLRSAESLAISATAGLIDCSFGATHAAGWYMLPRSYAGAKALA